MNDGGQGDLAVALRAADDARAACRAVVTNLRATNELMPSVYLERGERLRCMAVGGYWQIFDGMLPSVGVIGTTWREGVERLVADVADSDEYLAAAPGVHGEICCPLLHAGTCVGALNVEAQRPLEPGDIDLVRGAAAALSRKLEDLGGPPMESAAQRLVRHAAQLNALDTVEAVRREVVSAALDVIGLTSGAFVFPRSDGTLGATAGTGSIEDVLCDAPQEALRTIADFVAAGASCHTVGDPGGGMAAGIAALRAAGAESLAAAAIGTQGDFVLLADDRTVVLATDEVELLELLCAHAAASLRTAVVTAELRARAASDPLTGLGHHATFHETLSASRPRADIAVLIIDIDGFKAINDTRGHQTGDRLLRETAVALRGALRRGDELFRIGGDEFAAIINVVEDKDATDTAQRLRSAVRAASIGVTVSIGVAMAHPDEAREATVARADRALYEVKAGGRDGVALAAHAAPVD